MKLNTMGLLPARDEEVELAVESWSETLHNAWIPLEQVAHCFERAVFEHKGKRNITVTEVLQQWFEIKPKDASLWDGKCSNTYCHDGWELSHRKVVNGMEYTGVIPCNSCRAGFAKGRMVEMAYETKI